MHNLLNFKNLLILSCLVFGGVSNTSTVWAADSKTPTRREELKIKNLFDLDFQYNEIEITPIKKQLYLTVYSYSYMNWNLEPQGQFNMNDRIFFSRRIEVPIKLVVKVIKSDQTFSLVYANNDISFGELLNLENKTGADLFETYEGIRSDYSLGIGKTYVKAKSRDNIVFKGTQLGSFWDLMFNEKDKANVGHSSDEISIEIVPINTPSNVSYYLDRKFGPTFMNVERLEKKFTLDQVKAIRFINVF
jgi:hypothetical protein